MEKSISFILNGKKVLVSCNPLKTLLKTLREDLHHIEVKSGCEQGECGSCTVIIDGKIVNSCIFPVGQAAGKNIITIAGLCKKPTLKGGLHPLQKIFIEEGAVQCGFCTPGMILAAKVLLDRTLTPTDEEIREAISGNLCRCTGYSKIFNAVKKASVFLRNEKK
ncbi:MAG: (2Fe-2S)-binding protein [Elusimicrobia bacterium]|nr:(2Fe-2S)-binding protein [Elusimicrobiota bacterium]